MNQVEMHQTHDSAGDRIGGWLLVLCALLLVWGPVSAALLASNALSALSVRGPSLAIVLVAQTLVASLGVAAGTALLTRRGPAVTLAKAALILSTMMDVLVYATP